MNIRIFSIKVNKDLWKTTQDIALKHLFQETLLDTALDIVPVVSAPSKNKFASMTRSWDWRNFLNIEVRRVEKSKGKREGLSSTLFCTRSNENSLKELCISKIMETFKSPYHLSFQAVPRSLGNPIEMMKTKIQCLSYFGKQHRLWAVGSFSTIPWALEFLMVHLVLLAQCLPTRQQERRLH